MPGLREQACHNIDFVTLEHIAPQLVEALVIALPRGLWVPIVYNTSAYDAVALRELMDGPLDIYMSGFKF